MITKSDYLGDKIFTKFGENSSVSKYLSHFFSPNLVIIGFGEVGDLFGETFFTKFGEKIRDSLHFVTRNVQHFVKKWGQNKVIVLVKILSPNMVKMPVIHLNW